MNFCNRRLLLPLEDDGITVDDIILTERKKMKRTRPEQTNDENENDRK